MKKTPKSVEELISVYQQAQTAMEYTIANKQARGNVTDYQESLLSQIQDQLDYLEIVSKNFSKEQLPKNYRKGVDGATNEIKKMGLDIGDYESFSRLHTQSVEMLVSNMIADLTDATRFVGREMKDVIRKAGMNAIAQKQATGSTVKEAKRLVKQNLIKEGINGIKDRRGRMISLDAYAATVARSTSREATNTAKMTHLQANGYDLVQMSDHATTCPICQAYEGRVYSISGKDARYPQLDRAFSSHANIHPNCEHVVVPYVEDLADNPEADRKFSNRSFDIDKRSKAEIDRYNKQQKEKRERRRDRDQYDRYKMALGKNAPKSFSGFRRMKQSDSDNWQQTQVDYRETLKQIKK
jgi:hypothetical protein